MSQPSGTCLATFIGISGAWGDARRGALQQISSQAPCQGMGVRKANGDNGSSLRTRPCEGTRARGSPLERTPPGEPRQKMETLMYFLGLARTSSRSVARLSAARFTFT
ncbi:MAG: hypothetical protein AMXMBFR53_38510 [Gemmatimonadota bacterium]